MFAVLVCVLGGLAFLNSALGPDTASGGLGRGGCSLENEEGRQLLIQPQSSRLSCREIKQLMLLLPNAPGVWPLYTNRRITEICRVYKANAKAQVRCYERGHRDRHFEVVYLDLSARAIDRVPPTQSSLL